MRKNIQTKLHDPPHSKGNCFATVISCFLDCEVEDVPPIEEYMDWDYPQDKLWIDKTNEFLESKGWKWVFLTGHTDGYYKVTGKTKRSDTVYHCCIYKSGGLWHDPHPDQSGLITEEAFETFRNTKVKQNSTSKRLYN